MPRPKKPGAGEPKRRSRNGCWPCKARKVKCGEEKPHCINCDRQGETCDYSIRLNWGGRNKRVPDKPTSGTSSTTSSPHVSTFALEIHGSPIFPPAHPEAPVPPSDSILHHARSSSGLSLPTSNPTMIDPGLLHDSRMDAQYNHQYSGPLDYPSPSTAAFENLNFSRAGFTSLNAESPLSPPSMLPPQRHYVEPSDSIYQRRKRSHSAESPAAPPSMPTSDTYSPYPGPPTPYSPFMAMPLTPSSSVGSEDPVIRAAPGPASTTYPPPELRRLSVQSLLTGPPGDSPHEYGPEAQQGRQYPIGDSASTTYGYDLGLPDLDAPKNDDNNAIAIFSPPSTGMGFDDEPAYENSEVRGKDMVFEKGGYYAKPVPIKIPKALEPLPRLLLDNPMNLLYFHHFLNHTARILVPHDCDKNPFRQILPEMAVRDENVMYLLLAYSASHRARMLNHAEPATRIAVWVQDVFPKLRQAISSSPTHLPNSLLAPAIMMASLEVVSPNTFEVPISWHDHLNMARQMIVARGGPRTLDPHDRVAYFLSRWFAYLDVVGSLSGHKNDQPLGPAYWSSSSPDPSAGPNSSSTDDFQIDCLLGFTNRCGASLAHIADLAKLCQPHRIDSAGNLRPDWHPPPQILSQALSIRHDLEEGLADRAVYKGCGHRAADGSESEGAWDAVEIYATNEMFHWGGLIHLFRRVMGMPVDSAEVQGAVREIVGLLYKVRRGSTAEACLLFPMFAAGCEARDSGQRERIMERLRCVEGFGIAQGQKAQTLLRKVWETGKPWESLVEGEFFG